METWKLIPYNFYYSNNRENTKYYISNKGNIKNMKTGRLLRLQKSYSGRYKATLHDNNTPYSITVHLVVAELFVDNPHNKKYVKHIDGDFSNNSAENLEWIDWKERKEDFIRRTNK